MVHSVGSVWFVVVVHVGGLGLSGQPRGVVSSRQDWWRDLRWRGTLSEFVSGAWRERMQISIVNRSYCVIRPANTWNYIDVCYSYPELYIVLY